MNLAMTRTVNRKPPGSTVRYGTAVIPHKDRIGARSARGSQIGNDQSRERVRPGELGVIMNIDLRRWSGEARREESRGLGGAEWVLLGAKPPDQEEVICRRRRRGH